VFVVRARPGKKAVLDEYPLRVLDDDAVEALDALVLLGTVTVVADAPDSNVAPRLAVVRPDADAADVRPLLSDKQRPVRTVALYRDVVPLYVDPVIQEPHVALVRALRRDVHRPARVHLFYRPADALAAGASGDRRRPGNVARVDHLLVVKPNGEGVHQAEQRPEESLRERERLRRPVGRDRGVATI
jgi:hypothetical protein